MRLTSTRDSSVSVSLIDAILTGFSVEGGLFVPKEIPVFSKDEIKKWASLSFPDLCLELFGQMMGSEDEDLPKEELRRIIYKSLDAFDSKELVQIKDFPNGISIVELWHGPTFAFKDISLQFLSNLMDYYLHKKGKRASILVSTSGDTGSAVIHGIKGKPSCECYVLFPTGMVTEFQEKQMTTVPDSNIHVYSVTGTSDDLDLVVKAIAKDKKFCKENQITFLNSFNWGRIMFQTSYFFYSLLKSDPTLTKKVSFSVPTGAMGSLTAGYLSYCMGLPIHKFVVATNQNNILHRFFQGGEYKKMPVVSTLSCAMDIQEPYNFERFLYFVCRDSSKIRKIYERYEEKGVFEIDEKLAHEARKIMVSETVDDKITIKTIKEFYDSTGYMIDPHTAVGVKSAQNRKEGELTLCLSTAHPCKFQKAIYQALQKEPPIPSSAKNIFTSPTYHQTVTNFDDIESIVRKSIISNFKKNHNSKL